VKLRFALLTLVLLVFAAAGAAAFAYTRLHAPFRGYDSAEQMVSIPQGLGTRAIGARLVAAGVVRDELTFRLALWRSGQSRSLQAGEYRFNRPMTVTEVLAKIARGDVDVIPITFPEGLTIAEMGRVFEDSGLGTAAAFAEAARAATLVESIDPDARDLEGYLFPDTYSVSRQTDARALVRQMVDRFKQVASDAMLAEAHAQGFTARQVVTLASLVEKETARADERSLVAAVYRNRLRARIALQCDPTVIYAMQRVGRYHGNIRKVDLEIDSPYNTYRYPGLPPGPIAAPGQGSLEAAAMPADVDYLYFVSRNDGSHAFARTLEEHNRNVQRFQVEYFRAGGAGRAGRAGGAGDAGASGGKKRR
jgi:UPF0755 protein